MKRSSVFMFDLVVQGKSRLAKMLSTVVIGDFNSVYLAVLHGVDPTPGLVQSSTVMSLRMSIIPATALSMA